MNEFEFSGMTIAGLIEAALKEDVGDGDHTSLACIDEQAKGKAIVKIKESGVLAGMEPAAEILKQVDPSIHYRILISDGTNVHPGDVAIELEGNIPSILKAERLLLNCMQRMSGIATATRKIVDKISGTHTKILDTRKTTPNFRMFEKRAVQIGGGFNHRFGLFDMILIKDNHVDACGGITQAIKKANAYLEKNRKQLKIEIETRSLEEVREVLECGGVHRIMLDNFTPALLKEAVTLIHGRFETEASGGITEDNILAYAQTGVDFISVGALTHSYKSLDISLKIVR
ncbi:MAG: carboxylating nicotinate-nucleotide diphosphorylase [Bacteroidetes bacterium]|nr:carboxylating nicotinate-nucleotide diphosphorylase [Bacteroidota bacterium]